MALRQGIRVAPIDDTMLMSYAMYAGLNNHGMDELSEKYLGHKPIPIKDLIGSGKTAITFDRVPVAEAVMRHALDIVRASRPKNDTTPDNVKKWVAFGASVRAAQFLVLGGKARALTSGRYHVSFEDIRALAHPVLRHRVLTNFRAESEGYTSDMLVDDLLKAVPVPKSGM